MSAEISRDESKSFVAISSDTGFLLCSVVAHIFVIALFVVCSPVCDAGRWDVMFGNLTLLRSYRFLRSYVDNGLLCFFDLLRLGKRRRFKINFVELAFFQVSFEHRPAA